MNFAKTVILFLFFFIIYNSVYSQHQWNFGLKKKLELDQLPVTKGKEGSPVRVPKVKKPAIFLPIQSNEWALSEGWELAEAEKVISSELSLFNKDFNTANWYNATVPGTVLTTLVNQGVYPDPYKGLNNLNIPDSICRNDWWYRIPFSLPEKPNGQNVWLLFNGINYNAEVWFNGKLLGKIKGAFTRDEFEITQLLKESNNILAVKIIPPPNPGIPHEQSPRSGMGPNGGQLALNGPTFISSEGWDWIPGIRDRNIGIWQDVRVKYTKSTKIIDPQVITDLALPDTTNAFITIKTDVLNTSNQEKNVIVKGSIEGITFTKNVKIAAKEQKSIIFSSKEYPQLKMKNPRLWWPNGYGKPSLYKLKIDVNEEENLLSDSKTLNFGIRELSYELSVDMPEKQNERIEFNPIADLKDGKGVFDNVNRREVEPGIFIPKLKPSIDANIFKVLDDKSVSPYLVIRVNGKRIFCKGGNWGMDDGMKRVSRERLEPSFELHKRANYNMIRNWTGESTEEIFYQLCDEYGMLVWNDFWMSTGTYNLNPLDEKLFIDNALDVVKRFRNHPSIAIWCPRNEGYAPEGLEDPLSDMIASEDGTRLYIGNSREINLRQSGPWSYVTDRREYYNNFAEGFSTEVGTLSAPTANTIRKFMEVEDQWPISDVWVYHDLHEPHNSKGYIEDVDKFYGKAENLDDFSKKVQLINYNSHRAIFESWNSKLWNNASGVLLWMTHPAWPSMTWQTYSYDFETHGSYFGAKKACEPLHIQMNLSDNKVVVVNTTLQELKKATASLDLYNLKGEKRFSKTLSADIRANQLTNIFTAELPGIKDELYIVRLNLYNAKNKLISSNDYLNTSGENYLALNNLSDTKLSGKLIKSENKSGYHVKKFQIVNNSKDAAIGIKLNLLSEDVIVLPAYFSDGYFNLLPGEVKELELNYKPKSGSHLYKVIAEGYNGKADIISF